MVCSRYIASMKQVARLLRQSRDGRQSLRRSFASSTATTSADSFVRPPVVPYPSSPRKQVPLNILRPPYATTGRVPMLSHPDQVYIHGEEFTDRLRQAARLARRTLDLACEFAKPGITTDEIDTVVHEAIISEGAYPSPLNYAGFPKSVCSSINEVICHGIPDGRALELGDIVSFDVSCFLNGVHGDNCATILIGDEGDSTEVDWRGVHQRTDFNSAAEEAHFIASRRLIEVSREALYAAIATCRGGSCLSAVGGAIDEVAEANGYQSVRKYRGHGISHEFHCSPFVKQYRNQDRLTLDPGMIFTIEPMLVMGNQDCFEWDDEWTVATVDGSLAAQFEHTILVTDDGAEILTLPE